MGILLKKYFVWEKLSDYIGQPKDNIFVRRNVMINGKARTHTRVLTKFKLRRGNCRRAEGHDHEIVKTAKLNQLFRRGLFCASILRKIRARTPYVQKFQRTSDGDVVGAAAAVMIRA